MSRLKLYAHTHLPERAVSWLEAARRRSYKGDPATRLAHSRFVQLNEPRQPGLITMREGIQFFTHADSFESFQWFCWRSLEMVKEYDQFVWDCPDKSKLLDVGACHGVYSLTFVSVNPGGRAIAVEPSPVALEILEHNIAANGFGNRINVVSHAAGENSGIMYAMPNRHHLEAKRHREGATAVRTKSIDAICESYAFTPDLVKIDVEGFELNVLQGAMHLLARRPVIYLEVHPQLTAKLGYDHTRCYDLLSQVNYDIHEVTGHSLTRREFSGRHHTFFTVCR